MKPLMVLLLVLVIPAWAHAQYSGPAVEACRALAKKDLAGDGPGKQVVLDRDAALTIERYTEKIGTQFVSSVLTGNGAIVLERHPAIELAFICLLADDKRPVFFHWLPRQNARAATQCRRGEAQGVRPCLEALLHVADMDLGQIYALRFQEARERDSKGSGEAAVLAFRNANDAWRQYREAECARHRGLAPAGMSPDDYQLACTVDVTRRRALEMR